LLLNLAKITIRAEKLDSRGNARKVAHRYLHNRHRWNARQVCREGFGAYIGWYMLRTLKLSCKFSVITAFTEITYKLMLKLSQLLVSHCMTLI